MNLTIFRTRAINMCLVGMWATTLAHACWAAPPVPRFEIADGLVSHQVLQRDEADRGTAEVSGTVTCEGAHAIQARVVRRLTAGVV